MIVEDASSLGCHEMAVFVQLTNGVIVVGYSDGIDIFTGQNRHICEIFTNFTSEIDL